MRHSHLLRYLALGLLPALIAQPTLAALSFSDSDTTPAPQAENDFLPSEMESLNPEQAGALPEDAMADEETKQDASSPKRFFKPLVTPESLTTMLEEMADDNALMHRMPHLSGMVAHPGKWKLSLAPQAIQDAVNEGVITEEQARFSFEQQQAFYEWAQDNPNPRYLIVNVPTYDLTLYDSPRNVSTLLHHYTEAWGSKSIVGRAGYESPEKTLNVVSLKYNPTWTPTASAIRRSILKENGDWNWGWIDQHNFIPHLRETGQPITWVEATHLPIDALYFVEPSGPKNTLGEIKFETDSKNYIYLHDTNARWYFDRNDRAISTGCVRVEDPKGLAAALLYQDVDYVQSQIDTGEMFWEKIHTVPLYFMYDIVEYGDNGEVLGVGYDPYDRFDEWVETTIHHDMSDFDYEVKRL